MANLLHKPTLYDDPATAWLMRQSKAALADMLTEILRCEQESHDDPATAEAAEAKLAGILSRRSQLRGAPKKPPGCQNCPTCEGDGWTKELGFSPMSCRKCGGSGKKAI